MCKQATNLLFILYKKTKQSYIRNTTLRENNPCIINKLIKSIFFQPHIIVFIHIIKTDYSHINFFLPSPSTNQHNPNRLQNNLNILTDTETPDILLIQFHHLFEIRNITSP